MNVASDLQTLPDLLRSQARRNPDQPFVRFKEHGLTYGDFDARTDELAAGMTELGVKPGDLVSVFLPNCIEFLEAWWAILKAGGVLGPVNPAYTGSEAGYIIGHSEAVALVTDANGANVVAPEREKLTAMRSVISINEGGDVRLDELAGRGAGTPTPPRGLDDLAAILYTSGTTGKPKGAMLTHRNELINAAMGGELLPLGPRDRVGMLLPLFHANAQIVTCVIPMMLGLEVVMWERFSASKFWETVAELQPVSLSAVPTILAAVLNAPGAPSGATSLRYVICGAAPLSVELLEAFQKRFEIRILEGYDISTSSSRALAAPIHATQQRRLRLIPAARAGPLGRPLKVAPDPVRGHRGAGRRGLLQGRDRPLDRVPAPRPQSTANGTGRQTGGGAPTGSWGRLGGAPGAVPRSPRRPAPRRVPRCAPRSRRSSASRSCGAPTRAGAS